MFLEISQNSQENTCASESFLIKLPGLQLYLKRVTGTAQVFSCEFCKISKNTFLHRTPLVAASVDKESTKLREFRGNVTCCVGQIFTCVAWVNILRESWFLGVLRRSNIFLNESKIFEWVKFYFQDEINLLYFN